MTDTKTVTLRCEAKKRDGLRCQHPAKYLAPHDSSVVCGTHRRAFLRCIPISEITGTST